MPEITLEKILACPNLPSLPNVAVEVLNLTSKRNVKLDEIASVIQNDPALCVRILKTVNSSFYGLSQPCPTMTRALAYLGLNTVKSLVLGFSLVDCANDGDDAQDLQEYWGRSVLCAAVSRRLATLANCCDPEEAFLAAMMQDIGVLAFRRAIGAAYREVVARGKGDHQNLPGLCRQAFGMDHPEVGAAMARKWRLPENLIHAIANHHCDIANLTGKPVLDRLVALANHLVSAITERQPNEMLDQVRAAIGEMFQLSQSDVDGLIALALEDARALSRLLRVQVGAYPNVNDILAKAEEARIEHQLAVERETHSLQQTNSDLNRMVLTDALTGVGNRKHFDAKLSETLVQAVARHGTFGLVMVDADRFKLFNDTYGHQAGDLVLIEIAKRMSGAVKGGGVVCRYGGEEFAIILPGSDRKTAAHLAENVRMSIAGSPFDLRSLNGPVESVPVTISLGVAVYEPTLSTTFSSAHVLTQAADRALYAAKSAGRNCVRVFSGKAAASAAA